MAGSSKTPSRYSSSRRGEDFMARGTGRMPWQRRDDAEARRDGSGEDSVSRSVRAVERAVENFAALQQNCDYYRGLAVELRKAFDDEKDHAKAFAQQLGEAECAHRTDRERAARAESRLEQSAQTIRELERQLATVRAQTDRLVHTIARLMSADKKRDTGDIAALLAA